MGGVVNQITISKLKQISTRELSDLMPVEISSDGTIIGVVVDKIIPSEVTTTVQCPNCKLVFEAKTNTDIKPFYFTMQRPKA